jgi:hypothetical protein
MRHPCHVSVERHPSSPFFGILAATVVAMVVVTAYGYHPLSPFARHHAPH